VRLNGEVTSRTEFCVGNDLTLVCSIDNIGVYQWTVPGLVEANDGTAIIGNAAVTRNPNGLTFTLEATRNNSTTMSTLMFTVSDLLDGKRITCGQAGANAALDSQDISVFGK